VPAVRSLHHDAAERPFIVFWEVTRACALACRHCRANAMPGRDPGELSLAEGRALIDDLAAYGAPRPILVLTGGDPFEREDLVALVAHATQQRLHVALSPSVTPKVTRARLAALHAAGAGAVSLSLDGARPETHDRVRGIDGVHRATVEAARTVLDLGYRLQVNTTVTRDNVRELPDLLECLRRLTSPCGACSSSCPPAAAPSCRPSAQARRRRSCTGCTTSASSCP